MSKIFFDANILLDILLPSRPNHDRAMLAYSIICEEYKVLTTSENILTTIEYIASKNGTKCEVIWKFFAALQENFELYGFTNILEVSLGIYKDACLNKSKIDFEDLLQLQCAIKNRCDVFITEDKGIKKTNYGIKVINLNDVLKEQQRL